MGATSSKNVSCSSCKALTNQLVKQTAQLLELNRECKKQNAELEQSIQNVAALNAALKTLSDEFRALSEVLKEHGTIIREKTKEHNSQETSFLPVAANCSSSKKRRAGMCFIIF